MLFPSNNIAAAVTSSLLPLSPATDTPAVNFVSRSLSDAAGRALPPLQQFPPPQPPPLLPSAAAAIRLSRPLSVVAGCDATNSSPKNHDTLREQSRLCHLHLHCYSSILSPDSSEKNPERILDICRAASLTLDFHLDRIALSIVVSKLSSSLTKSPVATPPNSPYVAYRCLCAVSVCYLLLPLCNLRCCLTLPLCSLRMLPIATSVQSLMLPITASVQSSMFFGQVLASSLFFS